MPQKKQISINTMTQNTLYYHLIASITVPTVAVTASSNGQAPVTPAATGAAVANGTNVQPAPASASAPKKPPPSARSRWKKLTGTAMFINRLGKAKNLTKETETSIQIRKTTTNLPLEHRNDK